MYKSFSNLTQQKRGRKKYVYRAKEQFICLWSLQYTGVKANETC